VAAAGLDFQAECASSAGASVRLDGSASSDPDSTPGTHDDIAQFEWFENYGTSNQELLGSGEVLDVSLPLGEHLITLRVTDQGGLSDTDEVEVDVAADTTGPQIVVALSPNVLSPPDHRFRPIHATVTAVDACGSVDVVLLGVTSSDAGITSNPVPSSDIRGAATGTADYDFELRAERLGAGSGRIYTVTYQAADGAGNVSNGSAEVLVPHNRPPANSSLGRAKKSLRLR
jgi:hypothetical protein